MGSLQARHGSVALLLLMSKMTGLKRSFLERLLSESKVRLRFLIDRVWR